MECELTLYQPHPGAVYSLEVMTDLTGASRRSILTYYRQGMIEPVFLPPFGVMVFDEAAIRRIRQIERLRAELDLNLAGIQMIVGLLEELHGLREELEFWRQQ